MTCRFCNSALEEIWEWCPYCGWQAPKTFDLKEMYTEAIAKWGAGSQLDMVEEECLELMIAIKHIKRERGTGLIGLADEIVDAQIMIEQLILMFDLGFHDAANGDDWPAGEFSDYVRSCRPLKLHRLQERLAEVK